MRKSGLAHQCGLYLRTIRHLRPKQVAWRIRLRGQRRWRSLAIATWLHRRSRQPHGTKKGGWPSDYQPLDARRFCSREFAFELAAGRMRLLGSSVDIGDDWRQLDQPQLWRFHLHYLDWAWHLRATLSTVEFSKVFALRYRAWKVANPWGQGDAWAPYVVSLRLWTLCGLHQALSADESLALEIASDIQEQTAFLRWNCEHDVGGNHLLKNLKALVGAAVFLDDAALLRRMTNAVEQEFAIQVLGDGGHYERSPAYHTQVLGDLIDVEQLLTAAGVEPPVGLDAVIRRMRSWLRVMAGPHRLAPAFNDGPCVGADELDLLEVPDSPHDQLCWLSESGYVVAAPGDRVHLVMDVGDPCPDELPAHAHSDCLSFTLTLDGQPIVVDTGTSEYGAGERRHFERSTGAHNAVEIDRMDQTEIWSAFRAGRRARPKVLDIAAAGDTVVIDAEHDGYVRLNGRPIHRRRLTLSPSELTVVDFVRGQGKHSSASTLHLAECAEALGGAADCRITFAGIVLSASRDLAVTRQTYATAFGERLPCSSVRQVVEGELPHELRWSLSWIGGAVIPAGGSGECEL